MCVCKLEKKKKKHPFFGASTSNSYFRFLGYTVVCTLKKCFGKEEIMANWRCHAELEEGFLPAGIFTMFTSGIGTDNPPVFTA